MNGMMGQPQQRQIGGVRQGGPRRPNPGSMPPNKRREPTRGQGGTYPGNSDEVQQFIVDINTAMSVQVEQMLSMVQKNPDNVGEEMGKLASTVLTTVLEKRAQVNGGRRPHVKLVANGLKMILEQMAQIIAMAGLPKVTPKNLQEAAIMAGKVIDGGQQGQGGQGQQQAQQQSPPQQQGPQGGMLG